MDGFFHAMKSSVQVRQSFVTPFRLVFFMWLVYYIQDRGGFDFGFLGIYPRTLEGLIGVLTGPMIHGTVGHLIGNTIPLVFLGGLLFWYYPAFAKRVFWQCYFFTTILVWIFARPFYHIGSSGFIFALGFFLVFLGLFKRDMRTLWVSILVVVVYGGMLGDVLNLDSRISYESHVLGAVVGTANAFLIKLRPTIYD